MSAPASRIASARRGVIPRPSAAFSPLTMEKSTPSSSRRAGSRRSTARRPGAPFTSATKRILMALRDGERGGGVHFERDVVPRVLRVARERLALDAREVEHGADLRAGRRDRRADRQGGLRAQMSERDDERRLARRLDVDLAPEAPAADHVVRDADDDSVDRRVDVGARSGAEIEDGVRGALAPELVPGQPGLFATCDPPDESREEPFVRLLADRLEREGAGADETSRAGVPEPNAVSSSVTKTAADASTRTAIRRTRCCPAARRLRARRACTTALREGIGRTLTEERGT